MKKKERVNVKLEYPVEHNGKVISELSIRRMRAGDALIGEEETDKTKAGYMLLACLADIDLEIVELLDLEDFEKATSAMIGVMGKLGKKMQAQAEEAIATQ